ncbi:MAG: hypothetical protein IMY70_04350 [Bacteroidetes bacterium]|nr:hypothetical protein [Bacteroidota bacterium]
MSYSNLDHANHNESTCYYLSKKNEHNDWVITTAFYAALHFCRHKLFPKRLQIDGSIRIADTFEKYCELKGIYKNKHKELRALIESDFPEDIASAYNQLMDNCFTARYSRYRFSNKISRLSQRRLKAIKNYCLS